jgi:hypothetical protein
LPVAAAHHVEPPVAQIADGRHTGAQRAAQAVRDNLVDLLLGESGHPIEGVLLTVGNQVHVGVDEARQHGGCRMVDDLPVRAEGPGNRIRRR